MQATLAQVPSTITGNGSAAPPVSAAALAEAAPAAGTSNAFVINLISSTTPVVLTRPDHAGLKRFTFFVSRRREDGRERFRLHMGYFDTQEEAEKLLDIVRAIYPGAWAGLAPGRRLGIHAAPEGAAAPAPAAAAATPAAAAAAAAAARAQDGPPRVAIGKAIAPAAQGSPASLMRAVSPAESAALPRSIEVPTLALVPDEGRRQLSDVTLDLEEPARTSAPAAGAQDSAANTGPRRGELKHQAARRSLSNVRETIASLGDGAIRAPALRDIPELQPAIIPTARPIERQPSARSGAERAGSAPVAARVTAPRAAAPVAAAPAAAAEAVSAAELSDTGTLRLLETGNTAKGASAKIAAPVPAPAPASASAPREDKPYYAVQLIWSVQPIAMAQIPQLAIFNAYTLYGAEGNRDGRRWYGLRLGFFTDAVSAKQVAHYVRADFATVSVVPVTGRERDQALQAVSRGAQGAGTGAEAARTAEGASGTRVTKPGGAAADRRGGGAAERAKESQFAFIEGTDPVKLLRSNSNRSNQASGGPRVGATRVGGGRPSRGAPGKRAKQRPPGQIHANTRAKPKTLEETLEILGAGQLQVADEDKALLNDSGVRHLKVEAGKAKPSKLSRLIERLSERIGN
jgi:hypothetical protein